MQISSIGNNLFLIPANYKNQKEEKKKISEGLIKYYKEHPEKCAEISERMTKYREEYPKEKENFSLILKKAWALPEAKSIRKN